MGRIEGARTLFRLNREISEYLPKNFYDIVHEPPRLDDLDAFAASLRTRSMVKGIEDVFMDANCMPGRRLRFRSEEPTFALTHRMLDFKHSGTTRQRVEAGDAGEACPEVELRTVRSLDWLESDEKPKPNHRTAAVFYDVHGEPFGLLKGSGYPYVYPFRDAFFSTDEGKKFIPAGGIVHPIYDERDELTGGPHEDHAGKGLIGIRHAPRVTFLRLSTAYLPSDLRRIFLASKAKGKLEANLPAAMSLSNKVVEERTTKVLRQRGDIFMVD